MCLCRPVVIKTESKKIPHFLFSTSFLLTACVLLIKSKGTDRPHNTQRNEAGHGQGTRHKAGTPAPLLIVPLFFAISPGEATGTRGYRDDEE